MEEDEQVLHNVTVRKKEKKGVRQACPQSPNHFTKDTNHKKGSPPACDILRKKNHLKC
jgi:hypothetical protein